MNSSGNISLYQGTHRLFDRPYKNIQDRRMILKRWERIVPAFERCYYQIYVGKVWEEKYFERFGKDLVK